MSNRILRADLADRSRIPSEAAVYLTVEPENPEGVEARGRLMGPRCHHASTVEVAYHFRPVLVPLGKVALTLRAIIPEASRWSPQTPHLYSGPVEIWRGDDRLDARQVRLGLRNFSLGPRGLRCNGLLLQLRGRCVARLDDESALRLRGEGFNLLVAHVSLPHVWEIADRIGFAVLGRLEGAIPERLAAHPSCLGWIVADGAALPDVPAGTLVGTSPAHKAAARAHFTLHAAGADLPWAGKPALVVGDGPAPAGAPLLGSLLDD